MSAARLVYHPTLSHQVDPLLNISPLVDLYSNCLTHVVDTDDILHLQAHKNPIVLSRRTRIFHSSLSYQWSFAGVRSTRCLLTIASFFISFDYNLLDLLTYIIPTSHNLQTNRDISTRDFANIFPQYFLMLTNRSVDHFNFFRQFPRRATDADDCSLFFSLRLNQDSQNFPSIYGAVIQGSRDLEFNCSTMQSCANKIQVTTPSVWKLLDASWKTQDRPDLASSINRGQNPYDRSKPVGMEVAMYEFILGSQNYTLSDVLATRGSLCHPSFSKAVRLAYKNTPVELIPAGKTPVVKFVTTAGVFSSRSSYDMYFSPFLPNVWLGILISAGVTVATMVGVFRMQRKQVKLQVGLINWTLESVNWIFAAGIGQYEHSGIPVVTGRVVRIIAPVVVAWFIFSMFLVNVFSAIFNSDATRSFVYLTNLSEFLQLPQNVSTFILVNELSKRLPQKHENCTEPGTLKYCYYYSQVRPDGCNIYLAIDSAYMQKFHNQESVVSALTDPTSTTLSQRRLEDERLKLRNLLDSKFVLASTECLSSIFLQSQKPIAVLISDHDFQKYWKLFVKIMQKYPKVRVANNFDTDGSFLSTPIEFEYTSGLHPAASGSVVDRMRVLWSSGIYGLWEEWSRIRFGYGGLQYADKKLVQENKVDPVSFENSGTWWVFQALSCACMVTVVVFIIEKINGFVNEVALWF